MSPATVRALVLDAPRSLTVRELARPEIGDDDVVYCDASGYAANREKATSGIVPVDLVDASPAGAVEKFATPGITTIAAATISRPNSRRS